MHKGASKGGLETLTQKCCWSFGSRSREEHDAIRRYQRRRIETHILNCFQNPLSNITPFLSEKNNDHGRKNKNLFYDAKEIVQARTLEREGISIPFFHHAEC
jgi:hypothetical protein